jgi:hypothetical protein
VWPTSCHRRKGIATATTGCLRRIARSGPPSRRWRSGISASGATRHRNANPRPLSLRERAGVRVPGSIRLPQHPHPACGRPLPEGEARVASAGGVTTFVANSLAGMACLSVGTRRHRGAMRVPSAMASPG